MVVETNKGVNSLNSIETASKQIVSKIGKPGDTDDENYIADPICLLLLLDETLNVQCMCYTFKHMYHVSTPHTF